MPSYTPITWLVTQATFLDSAWRRLVIPLFACFAYFPLFWAHTGAGETRAHERRFDLLVEHPHPGRVQPAHDPRQGADRAGKFVCRVPVVQRQEL